MALFLTQGAGGSFLPGSIDNRFQQRYSDMRGLSGMWPDRADSTSGGRKGCTCFWGRLSVFGQWLRSRRYGADDPYKPPEATKMSILQFSSTDCQASLSVWLTRLT